MRTFFVGGTDACVGVASAVMHGMRWTLALAAVLAVLTTGGVAGAAPKLTYHGGPVMHAAGIHLVNYDSTVPAEVTSSDPGFLTTMAAHAGGVDNVWAVAAEYPDTAGPAANGFSYLGQHTITPAAGRNGVTITETEISDEIGAQIAAGKLPAPAGDGMTTMYVINMPHNKHLSLGGIPDTVCGFHFSRAGSGPKILMAVTGDFSAGTPLFGGCGTGTALANHQSTLSHEIVETVTDPLVFELNLAWYDDLFGEIADICALGGSAQEADNYGFTVQKQWSNALAQCVAGEAGHFSAPSVALDPLPAPLAGQAASFSAHSSSTNAAASTRQVGPAIAALDWDFGDGGSGSGGSPTHVYAGPGAFTVGVTARDALGFSAAASRGLTVASGTAPGGPTPAAAGAPASRAGTPTPAPAPATRALPVIAVDGSAKLTSSGGRLVLDTGRSAACPAGTGRCIVQVTVRAALAKGRAARSALPRVLGTRVLTVAPGHRARIVVTLGRPARRLVQRGRLALEVTLSTQRGASTGAPVRVPLRLRAPRRG